MPRICLFTANRLPSELCHPWSSAAMAGLPYIFPICMQYLWSSARVTTRFLVMFLTRNNLFPSLLAWLGSQLWERSWLFSNLFHFRMMEDTALMGTIISAGFFCSIPQICASTTLSLRSGGSYFGSIVWSNLNLQSKIIKMAMFKWENRKEKIIEKKGYENTLY